MPLKPFVHVHYVPILDDWSGLGYFHYEFRLYCQHLGGLNEINDKIVTLVLGNLTFIANLC